MTVSSKSKPYALLIEENIRHSDELCRVLNSNTSQIGQLTIELDHLAADYQDGQKIQDMTAEAYHGRLVLIQIESRKLDDMIGTLAGEILKKMENLLVILSRPTISKQTLLGLSEIGYDINLIVVSENALTESRKVVDVHHKYLFSRIQCYQANKMRFLSKLSLANSRDLLKPKQTYLGMAFSWFSGSEKEDEIVNEKLALSMESPGWVKKLWDTKCEDLPELPEDVLMRTLGVLLSQKPYNPSKKESSLVSSMKFAPLNLANLRERGLSLDAASVIENSQAGSLISNQFKSDCMEEMVDSTPSLHRLTRTTHESSHPATSLKRESSELRKSSATDNDLYSQSKEPSSKDRLTEIPFNQFPREANTDTLVLTESAMNYHLINQLAQARLDEINVSIPVLNTLLE